MDPGPLSIKQEQDDEGAPPNHHSDLALAKVAEQKVGFLPSLVELEMSVTNLQPFHWIVVIKS